MRRKILFWICILFVAFSGGGGCNLYSDMSDKSSDQVIADDARNLMDHGLWNDAILKLALLSAAGQQVRSNKVLLATAYAGRGGLNIVTMANNLNGASGNMFLLLMKAFKGATINSFNDMVTAESKMLAISQPASGRTGDENLFMTFLEFGKLGSLLAAVADTDADGTVDPTFDNCTGLTLLEQSHIVTAVGILVDSLTYVNNSVGQAVTASLSGFCTANPGVCNVTDVSTVTGAEQQAARTLAGESHYQVGLSVTSSVDKCEFSVPNGNCEGMGAGQVICP
jgi:hypothetical protein